MIEVKNLRIEDTNNGWTRAIADIDFQGMKSPYAEDPWKSSLIHRGGIRGFKYGI